MKSCLKTSSLPGSPDPSNGSGAYHRKCVAFNAEGSEEVHWADEWDRTPTEPAKKLSYQELLELKEIQQSLPHAPQPADPLRPGKQLLSMVPIGLLPLASAETSSPSPVSPPPQSPDFATVPQPTFVMPPGRARGAPTPPRMASASLTHLRPPAPPPPRVKPAFAFLPLLGSPSPSPPPTANSTSTSNPTSNAMNDASYFPEYEYPPARSAADGEPDRVLPSFSSLSSRARPIPIAGTAHPGGVVGGYEHAYRAAEAAAYSPPFGSSAYDYKRDRHDMLGDRGRGGAAGGAMGVGGANTSAGKSAPPVVNKGGKKKKKTVMFINDEVVEIEEDDDDEEEVEGGPPQLTLPPPAKEEPSIKRDVKPTEPPIPIPSTSPPTSSLSLSALSISPSQTSPRLAVGARPLSPSSNGPRPSSPLTPLTPLATAGTGTGAGRLSPVQARASSRLVRV